MHITSCLYHSEIHIAQQQKDAELRPKNLKKRFIKDKQYHEDYTSVMEDMIKKAHAEKSHS